MDADENPKISLLICVNPVHLRLNSTVFPIKLTRMRGAPETLPATSNRDRAKNTPLFICGLHGLLKQAGGDPEASVRLQAVQQWPDGGDELLLARLQEDTEQADGA